ncbi:uncharacterized protein MONBRDRAFT_34060 [Monosiga brevicollis MX1]|uniref:Glutamine amidotransferase type-2 domain-containing protein n=1 Tax=Monosiga brevicollis TaxID=81824 RepID=A9V989_MONBE|nr:uncharacterized protein MONBRDRAFT_34060 [Monosiga brevicollis MX1]EDQ85888.1 predicted protein [Monosiga brevicollis MX1]|eukprot:XP_001749367.1 hypothetical protein [Monosiga brevicollis MX1]
MNESEPCVYTSIGPAWNNTNLRQLSNNIVSRIVFAHVRAATEGTAVSESCYGRFIFMHNGNVGAFHRVRRHLMPQLKPHLFDYAADRGGSDSAFCFALFLNLLERYDAPLPPAIMHAHLIQVIHILSEAADQLGIADMSMLNFVVSDGVSLAATRFLRDPHNTQPGPATLYYAAGTRFFCTDEQKGQYRMTHSDKRNKLVIVTSEPLTNDVTDWISVPANHCLVVTEDIHTFLCPISGLTVSSDLEYTLNALQDRLANVRVAPASVSGLTTPVEIASPPVSGRITDGSCGGRAPSSISPTSSAAAAPTLSSAPDQAVIQSRLSRNLSQQAMRVDLPLLHQLEDAAAVLCLCTFGTGQLMTGAADGSATIWSLTSFTKDHELRLSNAAILSLQHVAQHSAVMASFADSTLALVQSESPHQILRTYTLLGLGNVLTMTYHNERLYLGHTDTTIRILRWQDAMAEPTTPRAEMAAPVSYTCFEGCASASTCSNTPTSSARFWTPSDCVLPERSANGPKCVLSRLYQPTALDRHYSDIHALLAVGHQLVSGAGDGLIKVWDVDTCAATATLQGHSGSVMSLAYCHQTATLFSCSRGTSSGTMLVYRCTDLQRVGTSKALQAPLVALSLLNDRPICLPSVALLSAVSLQVSGIKRFEAACYEAAQVLSEQLLQLCCEDTALIATNHHNPLVVGRTPHRPGRPNILLYGHYDVMPADEPDWRTNPWKLEGHSGYLYGRGSSDDKGPILAFATALAELQAVDRLDVNVYFLLEGEAENKSQGFREAVNEILQDERLKANWLPDIDLIVVSNSYWIDDERPCLNYSMRGLVKLEAIVSGPSFYDNVRPLSEAELQHLRKVNLSSEQYQQQSGNPAVVSQDGDALLMARWRQPCLTVTAFTTSNVDQSFSVLPGRASTQIAVRYVPDQVADDIVKLVEDHLRYEFDKLASGNSLKACTASNESFVECVQQSPWWLGEVESSHYRSAAEAIEEVWGQAPVLVGEGGTINTTSFLVEALGAAAIQIPVGQASDRAHLANERIRVLNLQNGKVWHHTRARMHTSLPTAKC